MEGFHTGRRRCRDNISWMPGLRDQLEPLHVVGNTLNVGALKNVECEADTHDT